VAALILPSSALVGLLILVPLMNGVRLAFTNASPLVRNWRWVGLDNFSQVLSDPVFWEVVGNTFLIVGCSVVIATLIGFGIALLLTGAIGGVRIFRAAVFQIWIVPWISVAVLWSWLFHADYGVLNHLLGSIGLIDRPIPWLARETTAQIALIAAFSWRMIPFMMVVSLAAIQSIPRELLDAASVDGAGYWNRVRYVILPLVSNAILIVCLLDAVRLFQEITVPWMLTGGGPVHATTTLSLYTYKLAFERWSFGTASAVGTLWLVFLVVFAAIYVRLLVSARGWRR
jgi:multiple sugar transport system permease protein